jgi:hypothetical protein
MLGYAASEPIPERLEPLECVMTAKHDDCSAGSGKHQMIFEEIMLLDPPPLRIKHARIPVTQIQFDPENPRLKYLKELFPGKKEKDLLFENADTNWLLKDVHSKGLLDPIYVREIGDSQYLVVEGNRRTAVMTELNDKYPDDPRFCLMPARILPPHTTPQQEALLMASFHVAGKVKWDAHEKAGHIFKMLHEMRIPLEEMSTTLHMGQPKIKQIADSYALFEHFKRMDDGAYANEAAGKWSFFDEMLKVKYFREGYREQGQEFADRFCRWVGEGRIPRAENVREIEEILKRTTARHLFETEPPKVAFEKAKREVDHSNPGRRSKFFAELEKVISLGRKADLMELDMARDNEAARDTVIEAYQTIFTFMERAGVRIPTLPSRRAA